MKALHRDTVSDHQGEEEEEGFTDGFPSLKMFLSTRENDGGAYTMFCDRLLQCVVGRRTWKTGIEHMEIRKVATVTDEAFALLLLENSWDRWIDFAINGQCATVTESKYTNGGIGKNSKKYMGWNQKGLTRFNELRARLKLERHNSCLVKFDKWYLANRIARSKKRRKGKENLTGTGNDEADVVMVTCTNDLGDDDNESDVDIESSDENDDNIQDGDNDNNTDDDGTKTSLEEFNGITAMMENQDKFKKRTSNKEDVSVDDDGEDGEENESSDASSSNSDTRSRS